MTTADWYFDFVSPYSYLALAKADALTRRLELRYRPILFAGLLKHWNQKGPAEIEPKRRWTYRWCTWWAQRHHIPFKMPAAHPFNPLPYLRLAHAAGCTPHAVRVIFEALWTTGADPQDSALASSLADDLGVEMASLASQAVKDAVRQCTEQALALGVFGVPTLRIDDELFWGCDAMALVEDYLSNPALFASAEMQRIDSLPVGAARKGDA